MPVAAQRGGGSTQNRSGVRNPGIQPELWQMIVHFAAPLHLDPYAVAAVSRVEGGGRFGEVGDNGSSFGPFQLHVGGALPSGRDAAWANSADGVLYAMRQMAASGAAGLSGLAAVRAIVTRFERPAAPGPEVNNAFAGYKAYGPYTGGQAPAGTGGGGGGGGGGGWQSLMAAQLGGQQQLEQMFQRMESQNTANLVRVQQQFSQSLASQAAQARQQALAQQVTQRIGAARTAQQSLSAAGYGVAPSDPAQALFEQRKSALDAIRTQAFRRAGMG